MRQRQAESRTKRSARNLGAALVAQVVVLMANFASRTAFVYALGVEILGVNALFANLLNVLAVAELGLGTAIAFTLYKPLSEGDESAIGSIVAYSRRFYRRVASSVAVLGLLLMPFLGTMVNTEHEVRWLPAYFGLLITDTVVSYLMAHRQIILLADQRMYVVKGYTAGLQAARSVAQIAVLLTMGSFFLYLCVQVAATLVTNLLVVRRTRQLYPYLDRPVRRLSRQQSREILVSVRAMLVYRIGGVVMNQTDLILISVLVGTAAVGYYSNYLLVVGSVLGMTELVFAALLAGVGNLNAGQGDAASMRRVFDQLDLIAFWVYGFLAVLILASLSDGIALWLGKEFVMSWPVVLAIALNFYAYGVLSPIGVYRTTTTLFVKTKYVFAVTAVVNLVLSIALGSVFGVPGILYATITARLVTQMWFEPWTLFTHYLGGRSREYFRRQTGYLFLAAASYATVALVSEGVSRVGGPLSLWRLSLVIVLPNMLFFALLGRTAAFNAVRARILSILR